MRCDGRSHHIELAEIVLDESGYTDMWQNDKTPEAPGRLENLKELVARMGEFDNLQAFWSMSPGHGQRGRRAERQGQHHDAARRQGAGIRRSCSCPAGRTGCFPHQRSLDESGLAGLEEERRLAYVGITRAKELAIISFAGEPADV